MIGAEREQNLCLCLISNDRDENRRIAIGEVFSRGGRGVEQVVATLGNGRCVAGKAATARGKKASGAKRLRRSAEPFTGVSLRSREC